MIENSSDNSAHKTNGRDGWNWHKGMHTSSIRKRTSTEVKEVTENVLLLIFSAAGSTREAENSRSSCI